jgi:hypothetical protein
MIRNLLHFILLKIHVYELIKKETLIKASLKLQNTNGSVSYLVHDTYFL